MWATVEVDVHERYGFDMGEPGALRARSWRWLSLRVLGLLSVDRGPTGLGGSRLQRALMPTKHPSTLPVFMTKAPSSD